MAVSRSDAEAHLVSGSARDASFDPKATFGPYAACNADAPFDTNPGNAAVCPHAARLADSARLANAAIRADSARRANAACRSNAYARQHQD